MENKYEKKDLAWFFKVVFMVGVGGSGLALGLIGIVTAYFSQDLPEIITAADYRPLVVTRVVGANGKDGEVLGEFYKEKRYLVPFEKIPQQVVQAFIAAEDDRFFEHPGINVASIIRASIANFRAGHVVQGGSTITQQVAKSLLLTSQRSFDRKIKEVILANRIEKNLSKQQILYLYLNQIYLGHGAYGVQAASKIYFRKDVAELNFAEAALLAGMPQAPGKYSPLLNPKRAKERQLYVLRRMLENRFINSTQMAEAASMPLRIYHDEDLNLKYAPYFVEHIRRNLVEKYGEKAVLEEGLTVNVPISRALALQATQSVRDGLLALDKRNGYRGPIKFLSNQDEVQKFLKESRQNLIESTLQYQLLVADGRMDTAEALKDFEIEEESELLEPGKLYQGVVVGFDATHKGARVMVGAIRGELSLSNMKWARPARDDKNPNAARPEPSSPAKVFKKGDVILVSLADSNVEKPESKVDKESLVQFKLEQEPVVQGAMFSMDTKTGQVLAMVGGYDFETSKFNRAVQAMRQPGSAFKPIIYASALEKGFTPASIIVDSPLVFKDSTEGSWKPSNYEEKFYGDTTFRHALIKSRNIPTVKIVQSVQIPYLIEYAKRLGMNGQFNADLSISLGSATTTLMDLTRVFSLFPRLGRKANPVFVGKVEDRDGKVLEEAKPEPLPDMAKLMEKIEDLSFDSDSDQNTDTASNEARMKGEKADEADKSAVQKPESSSPEKIKFPKYPLENDPAQVLDPRVAYVMTHLMTEVVAYGTGHEAKNLGRPAAGKTGTTNESIDAWFMGFTPNIVTGVWVGYDDQKSLGPGETGARAALPIWLSFMREAVKAYPVTDFSVPPGIVFANIDSSSGKLVSANASNAIKEAFIAGTEPTAVGSSRDARTESQGDFFKEDRE